MSETPDPVVVPDDLATRLRACAERAQESVDDTLRRLIDLALPVFEDPAAFRPRRWLLGVLTTDDGPTPPAGLEKVAHEFPRWRTFVLREQAGGEGEEGYHPTEPAAARPVEPSCEPCGLERDDGAVVFVEVFPTTGTLSLYGAAGERNAQSTLGLECPDAWLDFSARVWRDVMMAANQLADGLVAPVDDADDPCDPSTSDDVS